MKVQIETGVLRSAFYNFEYKMFSVICSALSFQAIQNPTEKNKLESAIKEKKTNIKNLETSIVTKSRAQINDTQEANFQEVLNQRMKIVSREVNWWSTES